MAGYIEYKDSNIPWIGNIPTHWNVQRGKNVLTLLDRPVKEDDEVITCFRDGEVTLRKNRREDGFTVSLQEIGYQGIEPGDLVVHGMDGFAGSIGVSDSRGKATPVLNVMDSPHNKRFLMYYLRMAAYKDVFMSLSTGIRVRSCDLRWNKLSVFPFILPERKEQDSIVEYIDENLQKIDSIIAEVKASIEEYKAWKASIIYEAVTKGLDPDVEMKDSGIEWIGTMPATWQLIRLKFLMESIVDCPHETPEYSNDGAYYVIRTADQDVGYLRPDENMYRLNEAEYIKRIRRLPLNKDDIVYGREGERWGLACIVPESNKYCLGQRMMQFRCNRSQFLPEFSRWALNSYGVYMQGTVDTIGSTSPHVNISTMRDYQIPIPPIAEQERIAKYITEKCDKIISLINEKEMLINDLEAYKKSLIFEVVTGKRRVC